MLNFLSCNSKKLMYSKDFNIHLSELSNKHKENFKDCIGDKKVMKLIPYFFSEKEQILIKNKGVKDFKFEVDPYLIEGCNGLYIYTLYPDKLIKRSHPTTKSSFIILDGNIYPASNDSTVNVNFLTNNNERLNVLLEEAKLKELGRIYKEGIFAIWNK
jgi:hypothetical protein